MNLIRPMMSIGANMMQNYALERIENRYKKYTLLFSLIWMVPTLWSYVDGDEIMTDINTISLMSIIIVLIGSFLAPMILESKAKAMGNTVDKLDFFGMLIGMALGAFFSYIVVAIYGGIITGQIGDFSYVVIGLIVSMILSALITLFAQAFMGDSWAVNVLDYNKDKKVNLKDVKDFITAHKSDATTIQEIINEVKETTTEVAEIPK